MARIPVLKPRKVLTPGSSKAPDPNKSDGGGRKRKGQGKKSSDGTGKRKSTDSGGGSAKKNPKRKRKGTVRKGNYRDTYPEHAMLAAVRLVREDGMSISKASRTMNVKRQTLNDRLLKYADPEKQPRVGRPQELSNKEEEDIVECLIMCAEFQYPMRKRDLQKLVQAYVQENNINVRWTNGRPGKEWVRNFQRRWAHRVKVKKPRNIKRSRGNVSPTIIKDFLERLKPQVQGVPATHFFNYDETNLKDDPGRYLLT